MGIEGGSPYNTEKAIQNIINNGEKPAIEE